MNYLVVLVLCVTLQVKQGQQQQEDHAATTTIPESPRQLAEWIVRSSCEADNLTSFYLSIREKENMDRRHPDEQHPNCKQLEAK